ncbi:MAG: hypothetical protein PHQ28_14150, partial [Mycobacterium sp.]|nr:hypothetical protein [Mycobacterium sp.]
GAQGGTPAAAVGRLPGGTGKQQRKHFDVKVSHFSKTKSEPYAGQSKPSKAPAPEHELATADDPGVNSF